MYYGAAIQELGLTIYAARPNEQVLEMLKRGRIDVAIGAVPDIQPYLDQLSYAPELWLYKGYDRLTCYNTPENRTFVDDLSERLKSLKVAGAYQQLSGNLYLDFDF
ncbi:hypothetical protein [Marinobacter sp.]|uniref:hypothetical protein n=1 Tax=Marinobacter sp. TaxID=50741 RepID=UPI0039A67671